MGGTVTGGGFHKAIYALRLKFALCAILFEQIYSNLTSCICALRSTFCILSQIFGALYALRPAPNFFEIQPELVVCMPIDPKVAGSNFCGTDKCFI
jgi:hypothetical protein